MRNSVAAANKSISTDELRQRLAGLIDTQVAKEVEAELDLKPLAIRFCEALPAVFGSKLDRITLWDKIASAIQSAYAKVPGDDIDLFVQHVLESIQASPTFVISNEKLVDVIGDLQDLPEGRRQDWMSYLVTHLVPVLVHARKGHKESIGGAK